MILASIWSIFLRFFFILKCSKYFKFSDFFGYGGECFFGFGFSGVTVESEVEDVVAERGFGWARFDFGEVDFAVFEVFKNGEEATGAIGGKVESDEGRRCSTES